DPHDCCGFGGSFSVKYEDISVAMGTDKAENIMSSGADYLISGDMSCLMHLDGILAKKGSKIRSLHIADVLAAGW
ncbi:MAG TPA: (Fe-S)-binding protein, partial [Bacteroidetes bacterium]|nr:(Fe-S)-binding protein [Bacteroidota bacterium]